MWMISRLESFEVVRAGSSEACVWSTLLKSVCNDTVINEWSLGVKEDSSSLNDHWNVIVIFKNQGNSSIPVVQEIRQDRSQGRLALRHVGSMGARLQVNWNFESTMQGAR